MLSIGERVRNCILTHSTVDWTYPALDLLQTKKGVPKLSRVFGERADNVFTAEDYRFEDSMGNITQYLKSGSFIPFLKVCADMDVDPRECAMVEDSLSNLKVAKLLGMQTIYVCHGKPMDTLPPYVDHQVDSVADLKDIPLSHRVANDAGFTDFVDEMMARANEKFASDKPKHPVVEADHFPKPSAYAVV